MQTYLAPLRTFTIVSLLGLPVFAQFVVALFPIGHEVRFGHCGAGFFDVGFDAIVNCNFGILAFGEALAVFDDCSTGSNVTPRFVFFYKRDPSIEKAAAICRPYKVELTIYHRYFRNFSLRT